MIINECSEVRVLDNFSVGTTSNIEHLSKRKNFHVIKGDILDKRIVRDCVKGVDVVFHLAAFMEKTSCAVNAPIKDLKVNAEGTLNVLEASRKEKVKKIIYTSSCAVYGQAKYLPQDENHPLNPNWPYGVSKLAAEKYVRDFFELYGLETTSLRIAMAYGPREWFGRVMTKFIKWAVNNQPLIIFGDGRQTRDFVHVSDVVNQLILCAEVEHIGGEVFNAGSGERTSINALADIILETTEKKGKVEKIYADPKPGEKGRLPAELKDLQCDMSKAKKHLGHVPKVRLTQGIRRQISLAKQK